jgi:hypothetical protein
MEKTMRMFIITHPMKRRKKYEGEEGKNVGEDKS